MKTLYLILISATICLFLSFTTGRRDCHVSFGVNSKFIVVDESKTGDYRLYSNKKGTFKLGMRKIESESPESESLDSLRTWLSDHRTCQLTNKVDYDTLVMNNILLKNVNFTKIVHDNTWSYNTFVFSSKSHFYKMEISYLTSKEEKSKKEISKILHSLKIDC